MKTLIFTLLLIFSFVNNSTAQDSICLPLKHLRVNSAFGWRIHPVTGQLQFHRGIDLAARSDTVYCVLPGIVQNIGNDSVTGNYIIVAHSAGVVTLYGHLSAIAVMPGEQISAGDPLGITGATGRVTGEHLHFAVRLNGRDLPPLAFLAGLFRPP